MCHYDYTETELVFENCEDLGIMSAYLEDDDACSNEDSNIPVLEPPIDFGFKICNNENLAFDRIPVAYESGFTGEMIKVQLPAVHTETGETVNAFWGAWCVTFGTSAFNVNSERDADRIFREAWELSTEEVEIWLNQLPEKPTDKIFSLEFLEIFRFNINNLAGMGSSLPVYIAPSTTACQNTRSTVLKYCQ